MVLRGSSLATPARARARELSQLLPSAGALAVQRPAARGLSLRHDAHDGTGTQDPSIDAGERREFAADVVAGLDGDAEAAAAEVFLRQRRLGAVRAITELPEYYPTRSEIGILNEHAGDIAALIPPGAALIEFGSGSSTKTRIMLSRGEVARGLCAGRHLGAVPAAAGGELRREYPELSRCFRSPPTSPSRSSCPTPPRDMPRVGFFPGSTIGNFEPHEAAAFLRHAGRILGPRRDLHRRRRSGEGHAGPAEGLQRSAGRDREVQSQSAGAHQPRARRQVQSRPASSITPSSTASARASRCIWRASSASASGCAASASSSAPAKPSTPRTATSIRWSRSARWRAAPAGRRSRCGPTPTTISASTR